MLEVNGTSTFSGNMLLSRTNTAGSLSGITVTNAGTTSAYAGININSGSVSSQLFNDAAGNAVVAGTILRTTTDHPLVFGTNNNERMRITNGGNIGVGVTTPQYRLDVNAGTSANFQASFGASINSGTWTGIHFGYTEAGNLSYRKSALVFERQDSAARGKVHILNNGDANGNSAILADSKMTLQFDGNVGIGTTSPPTILTVARSGNNSTSPADSASIVLTNRNTSISGGIAGGIFVDTYRDVANPHYSGGIWFTRRQTAGNLSSASDIVFGAMSEGSTSLPTARMRLIAEGNLGIATDNPVGRLSVELASATSSGATAGLGAWDATYALFGGTGAASSAVGIGYNSTTGGSLVSLAPGVAWRRMNYLASEHRFYSTGAAEALRIDDARYMWSFAPMIAWNTTTPGIGRGSLHIGSSTTTDNSGGSITFGAKDAVLGETQAGIYINSSGNYGTRMYFATTNNYGLGSITGLSIDEIGIVRAPRDSIRAKIFYHVDSTTYSLNPNGTSSILGLTVANAITGNINGYATHLPTRYDSGQKTNPQTYFGQGIGLRVAMTGMPDVWSDTLWINGYSGSDVLNMCALHFSRGAATPRMWITSQQCTATSYGTFYEIPTIGYNHGNTGEIFAGKFTDSANTAYYVDPDSGTKLRGVLQVEGDHYDTEIRLTAIASTLSSGASSAMSWWVSEPNVTWNDGGFGFNVTNDGGANGFGRLNTSFGQAYTRYTTAGNMIFYCTNTGGTRYTMLEMSSANHITALTEFRIQQSASSGFRIITPDGTQSLWVRAGYDTDGSATPAAANTNVMFQSSGSSAGTFTFVTGNSKAITIAGDYALAAGSLRAPIFYHHTNTGYSWTPNSSAAHRFTTPSGYIELGPMNTGFCHFATDRGQFYFGQDIHADGVYKDYDDTSFVLDPASTSNFNILSFGSSTRQMLNLYSNTFGFGIQDNTIYCRSGGRFSWHRGGAHNSLENTPGTTENPGTVAMTLDASSNLTVTGNVTAYSDIRIKENIEPIENATEKLAALRGVTYNRIDLDTDRKYAGVIAQEIEKVLPEAIFGDEDTKTVDYNATIALLIQAVNEQQEYIRTLEAKVQTILDKLEEK
jgi:hypothetical protein